MIALLEKIIVLLDKIIVFLDQMIVLLIYIGYYKVGPDDCINELNDCI